MAVSDEQDLLIAAYALGALDQDERALVEEILATSAEARSRHQEWSGRLAPLDLREAPEPPPSAVWAGISEKLGFETTGIRSTFSTEGSWIPMKPGVEIRYLEVDPASATRTAMLRMAAGSVLQPHHHAKTERCFIVEGEVSIGEGVFRRNDYHIAPIDTIHQEVKALTPALVLLHWA